MGCINSTGQFDHWFGNIHLSGPCNRSCYFCIGQHMMGLDPLNTLNAWPIPGIDDFVKRCVSKGVKEVNLTGSNTDPLLYRYITELTDYLRRHIPDVRLGIRTNGARALAMKQEWRCFDKASISLTSLDPKLYAATMGSGEPPAVWRILAIAPSMPVKVNIVLCPETAGSDLANTLCKLADMGVRKVNLREPYGQPHIGDPLAGKMAQSGVVLGMPLYQFNGMDVVYWDVHYVEVESVNLYATGKVSETYPITRGYSDETGNVIPQDRWEKSGRQCEQWKSHGQSIKSDQP